MSDKSLDKSMIFLLLSMFLFTFSEGIDVGASLEKRRHCEPSAPVFGAHQTCPSGAPRDSPPSSNSNR